MPVADLEDFVRKRTRVVTLDDGTDILVRPIVPADSGLLLEGFGRLSPESRWRRFLMSKSRLTDDELRYLTEIDYFDHFAWGAQTVAEPIIGLGVGRYVRVADEPTVAEAAVVVIDEWQGRGIGTVLLELLTLSAVQSGVEYFRAYIAPGNAPARSFFASLGAEGHYDHGLWVSEIHLPTSESPLRGTPLYRALVAAASGALDLEPPPHLADG